jgi:penicillin amidase
MRPLRLKHARRHISVARDDAGVPHVEAESWREAIYGLGYMHALDRPTQMLFARSIAAGRSAEMIADRPELSETDRFFRRAGLYLRLEDEVRALDDDTFAQLTAYCEGANDGMQETGRSLAMWATGFQPSPWNQEAVLLIGNLLSYGGLAVGQQQNERLILELIQAGVDDALMTELFSPQLDEADFNLLRRVKISRQLSDEALELITDLPRLAGSNAWAVSPRRSASDSALLASDPHLEINRLPAIWYEAVLRWGPHYVLGASLPGCPLFAVARTERLAWGVTYMKGDTCDYFIEDCRRGELGWQYLRGAAWRDFEVREETISHKSKNSESLRIYHNPQGTLDGDPDVGGEGLYLSTAWTGSDPGVGRSIGTWLKIIAADNVAAAMDIARECPQPTLCWVMADREGHIGLQGCGSFPRRRMGHSGLLPAAAWDEANHWHGRLPTRWLPSVYDPPEGFIASANENINPPGGPEWITLPVPSYRKERIVERLAELPKATLADMQRLQYDVVSMQARKLLPIFLPYLKDGPIRERLAAWDGSYNVENREATLFARLYRNVLLEIFGQAPRENGGGIGWRRMLYLSSRVGYSTMVLTVIDRLLEREEALWWQGRDKGALIRAAGTRLEHEPDQPWGEVNVFHFVNRFFPDRRVGRVLGFHSGKMPMPGCYATPFQGHLLMTAKRETSFAPSYHFVTDLATDEAWTNLPGGPSESRFSPFYKSDVPRWQDGDYKLLSARQ